MYLPLRLVRSRKLASTLQRWDMLSSGQSCARLCQRRRQRSGVLLRHLRWDNNVTHKSTVGSFSHGGVTKHTIPMYRMCVYLFIPTMGRESAVHQHAEVQPCLPYTVLSLKTEARQIGHCMVIFPDNGQQVPFNSGISN